MNGHTPHTPCPSYSPITTPLRRSRPPARPPTSSLHKQTRAPLFPCARKYRRCCCSAHRPAHLLIEHQDFLPLRTHERPHVTPRCLRARQQPCPSLVTPARSFALINNNSHPLITTPLIRYARPRADHSPTSSLRKQPRAPLPRCARKH